jgi:hypothetical protein
VSWNGATGQGGASRPRALVIQESAFTTVSKVSPTATSNHGRWSGTRWIRRPVVTAARAVTPASSIAACCASAGPAR